MGKPNTRREASYAIYRKELEKWKASQGTVFAAPAPVPSQYGLSEWEAGVLHKQTGITPVATPVRVVPLPPVTVDPPYTHIPTDNEPF